MASIANLAILWIFQRGVPVSYLVSTNLPTWYNQTNNETDPYSYINSSVFSRLSPWLKIGYISCGRTAVASESRAR